MRSALTLFLMLIGPTVAGEFKEYENETGDFILPENVNIFPITHKNSRTGDTINYLALDARKKTKHFIFPIKFREDIRYVIYEERYHTRAKKIIFSDSDLDEEGDTLSDSEFVKNNQKVKKRRLRNRILFLSFNDHTEKYSLWSCDRRGRGLKKITSFRKKYSQWYIDAHNSRIVVYIDDGLESRFQFFPW